MPKIRIVSLIFLLVWGGMGCDRKPEVPNSGPASGSAASPSESANVAPSTTSSTTASGQPAATPGAAAQRDPVVGANPAISTPNEADHSMLLVALTQALRKYSAEKQRVPKSLQEVVSAGYITKMPQAPAGKKFSINPARVEVILVKQ